MSTPSSSTPTATKKPALPPELAADAGHRDGAATPPPKKKRRFNWRKLLFRLHGWLGLNLGLLLFVICLSGSVATLSHEIDWLLDPAQRVAPPPAGAAAGAATGEASYDWTAMHDSLGAAFPDGQNLGVYVPGSAYAPASLGAAAVAYVELPAGQTRKVYLNPYTGAVQGHTSFFNVQRFFRSFHRRFFDGDRGIVLVTLMGLPMLLIALSGLVYYKGWLKQLFRLRTGKGRRTFWADLHKGAGIWGLLFTLVIALTSIFYFVELGFIATDSYDALQEEPLPQVGDASLEGLGPQPELLPAGRYAEAAREALPGLDVRSMRLPHQPGGAVYVDGQAGNPLTRDRANKVHLHPFTGKVLGAQKSSDLGAVPLLTDLADPLHFGYFGGLWTKVLWCALGLVLTFSILAGTYLWVVRSGLSRRASLDGGGGPRGVRPFVWLRGAVVAAALTLAYFAVAAWSTVEGIQDYAPQRPAPERVAEVRAGPYRAQIACAAPCRVASGEGATLTARFEGAGLPSYRVATLGAPGTPPDTLRGPARAPSATVRARPGDALLLRVTERGGAVHTARFSAPTPGAPAPRQGHTWPQTAPGVWWVVGAFAVLTAGSVAGWLALLARAFRKEQHRQTATAR